MAGKTRRKDEPFFRTYRRSSLPTFGKGSNLNLLEPGLLLPTHGAGIPAYPIAFSSRCVQDMGVTIDGCLPRTGLKRNVGVAVTIDAWCRGGMVS